MNIQNLRLKELAHNDSLTKLLNRNSFDEDLAGALSLAERHRAPMALLLIDLDFFKNVNDTYGHQAGDLLLQNIATRLKQCVRQEDSVARLGGDEFAIILTEIRNQADAGRVAKKIIKKLSNKFNLQDTDVFIGASIGIATNVDYAVTRDEIFKCADAALYRAKELGRGNYQYFSEAINSAHMHRMQLETDIQKALNDNLFELAYQPIYDLVDNRLIGVEALIRWVHPKIGHIQPSEILSLTEELGIMYELGSWVLATACREFENWQTMRGKDIYLAVNLSPSQMLDVNFMATLVEVTQKHNIQPQQISIELTNTSDGRNQEQIHNFLSQLRAQGFKLTIDDFGIGGASLTQLESYMPIDALKIDSSFIAKINENDLDCMLVRSIIDTAKNFQLRSYC